MEFLDNVEEEYGKCQKHPSRSRTGVCPVCLKNRLILLCPRCANVRPCMCYYSSDLPSSSTSSSSLCSTDLSFGRMSFLIDSEPAFRRSRSTVLQFTRQKSADRTAAFPPHPPEKSSWSSSLASFLSFLKVERPKKKKKKTDEGKKTVAKRLPRSRSVGFSCYSASDEISCRLKGWGWLPSPIKVFCQPKPSKVLRQRSPICRS